MLSGTPSVSLGDSTAASPRHRSVVLTSTDSDRRSRSASADQPPRRLHHNPYSSTNGDSNDNGGSRSPPRDASTDVPPVGRTNAPRRRGGRSQAVKTKSEGIAVTARHLERLLAAAPSSQGGASTCPAGFAFTVYSGDFTQHYHIPSEGVQITRGAIKYVDHHQRYGVQTRFRFQLCHNHLQGKCPKAGECSYIHATQLPAPTQVHLNPFAPRRLAADRHGRSNEVVSMVQDDPAVVASYEKLPPGYMLEVYPPNANTTAVCRHPGGRQMIPSDSIFRTVGAESALQVVASGQRGNSSAIGARPRHCAHYQFKRVCNLGSQCHFIHAAVPFDAPTPSSGAAVAAEQHQQPPHHVDAGHDSSNSTPPLTMHVVPPTSTSSANNSQPSRGPTPDEGSGAHQRDAFLAGMQYAMQLMRTAASASPVISPFQSGWSALEAFGTYVTPAQIPVQSPPSVGASPFVTGLAAQRLAAAGIPAPPSGPLGAVPKAAQQPSPQQRRSSAGMAR